MTISADYAVILEMAAANFGLVTRPRLLLAGVSPGSISKLLRDPQSLWMVAPGTYLVPDLEDFRFGWGRSALQRVDPHRSLSALAADPLGERSGVLSHHSAVLLYGSPNFPDELHLTMRNRRRLKGITTHTARLQPYDVTLIEGIPVTTVRRTTYDLGRWHMDGEHRSRWVEHCIDEGLLDLPEARRLLGPTAEETLMYLPEAWE